tara:strand:- start:413 stop:712 length:300 start_codon:yes stop_codon:yes gene_type:complete
MASTETYTSEQELRNLYKGLKEEELINMLINQHHTIRELSKNITVTRCCETLRDKETLSFDGFVKANNYTQNFLYFYRDGKTFKPSEIMKRYKTYLQSL